MLEGGGHGDITVAFGSTTPGPSALDSKPGFSGWNSKAGSSGLDYRPGFFSLSSPLEILSGSRRFQCP